MKLLWFFIFWPCCAVSGVLVLQRGTEPGSSAMRAWSPNQWITGEVLFLKMYRFYLAFMALQKFMFCFIPIHTLGSNQIELFVVV